MFRLALTVTAAAVAGSACAQPPFFAADSDAVLAVRVTAALAADPALAGLPLAVDVLNKVAVVGGPVPAADIVARIEAVVGKVPGLEAVKVSGWVAAAGPDPLAARVGQKLRGDAPPAPVLPPPPVARSAAGLPPLVLLPHPPAAAPRTAPAAAPLVAARPVDRPTTVTVNRYSPAPPPTPGWLGEPVAGAEPVAAAAARVAAGDARFRGLAVATAGGVVTVSGRVRDPADVWAFAAAVRSLPGVTRVVVGRVTAG